MKFVRTTVSADYVILKSKYVKFVYLLVFIRYTTVRVIVPAAVVFFQSYKVADIAKELLEVLIAKGLSNHPIFFHPRQHTHNYYVFKSKCDDIAVGEVGFPQSLLEQLFTAS